MASITQRFLVRVSTVSARNAWHNGPHLCTKYDEKRVADCESRCLRKKGWTVKLCGVTKTKTTLPPPTKKKCVCRSMKVNYNRSGVWEALPRGVLYQPSCIHFLVCSEPLSSFSQARVRRCYLPVRLCKPKRYRPWKQDLSGVFFHHSNQGPCCPSRFRSRHPRRQRSPSLYQPARLVGCLVWVPRSTPQTSSPRPGYETFQKTNQHQGRQTLFESCVSCDDGLLASRTFVPIKRVHYCPSPSFGWIFYRSSHTAKPPVLSRVQDGR